jgi:dTDP-4-dehydrorhamnose 3,5-epimerase
MGQFKFEKCLDIEDLYTIEPKIFLDERGYNLETYNNKAFIEAGLDMEFVQDNQSMSKKGVLRGLHFQKTYQQGKLVRVTNGEVFDVAVDLRQRSKTYGKWFGVVLSAEKKNMFYIPEGFAHGFLVLSDYAEFAYKLSDYYHPEDESGIPWNDKTLNIEWPILEGMKIIVSDRDNNHSAFSEEISLTPKRNQ